MSQIARPQDDTERSSVDPPVGTLPQRVEAEFFTERLVPLPGHTFPFEIGQGVQAVCTRCSGLYWGGLAGLLAGALIVGRRLRPRPTWLALALAPTVVDALLPWVGLPQLGPLARHLLAWPAGFMVGLILAAGIAELAISLRSERARSRRASHGLIAGGF